MNKLYERIDFVNGTTPALNDTNLNAMSKAIDDIDDRVVTLGTYAEDAEDAATNAELSAKKANEYSTNASSSAKYAREAVSNARESATSASTSATSAEEYAEEAAKGSGGNALSYGNNILSLKRNDVVLSQVTITGGGAGVMGTSDAYSSTTSYAVGAYCIDANALYKCLIACSGVKPSTDTSGCWEKVTLASLASGKSQAFKIVTAAYSPESATSVAANGNAKVSCSVLKSGEKGDILLGVTSPYTANNWLLIYSFTYNSLSVRNVTSAAKELPTSAIIYSTWLKWL